MQFSTMGGIFLTQEHEMKQKFITPILCATVMASITQLAKAQNQPTVLRCMAHPLFHLISHIYPMPIQMHPRAVQLIMVLLVRLISINPVYFEIIPHQSKGFC